MGIGRHNKPVTLFKTPETTPDSDGYFEALVPSAWWAAIEPLAPGTNGTHSITHLVTMRYHPQVGLDTCVFYGTRQLFVRGLQNVSEDDRELRLLCEEVLG